MRRPPGVVGPPRLICEPPPTPLGPPGRNTFSGFDTCAMHHKHYSCGSFRRSFPARRPLFLWKQAARAAPPDFRRPWSQPPVRPLLPTPGVIYLSLAVRTTSSSPSPSHAGKAYPARPKLLVPPLQKQHMALRNQARAGPRRNHSHAPPRQACKFVTAISLGKHLQKPTLRTSSVFMWSESLKSDHRWHQMTRLISWQ